MSVPKRTKRTPAEAKAHLREMMTAHVRDQRDYADRIAAQFKADDPLHPFMPVGDDQRWTDWIDFTEKVCVPLIEADGDEEAEQAAMAEYRKASPYFVAAGLYLAARRMVEP